jgi:Secretion system C-terminal sorting domain/F5/8 type C domain
LKSSFLLIFLLVCSSVAGTNYYIDPSGSNSNKGSSTSPWATLSYACSKATSPGDVIHVNPGTYEETEQSLLAAGVSIMGAGNTSIIHSDITTSSAFTLVLSSSSQGTNGNQSISYLRMEGGMTAYAAILVEKRINVSIHHCEFEDFYSRGVMFTGSGFTSDAVPTVYATGNSFHDNSVINCAEYLGSGKSGWGLGNLEIGGQDGMLIYNNTIIQEDRGTDSNGYCIKYCSNGYCKGLKIFNNTITKPSYDNSTWDFSIELWNSRGGIEIYNNSIQGGIDIGGNTSITNDLGGYGFAEKIHNNIIGFPALQPVEENGIYVERGITGGLYVYNNLIKNLTSAIVFYQGSGDIVEDLYVYYNIISGLGASGQTNFGNSTDWTTIDGSTNVTFGNLNFINNTIYAGTDGNPLSGLRFYFRGDATNITVRNNIIVGFRACPVYMETSGTITNVSIENNIFYSNGNWNQPEYSPVTPVNITTQNNLLSNPQFVSSSDFHLNSGSPAIGNGLNIENLTTDYDGNTLNNPPSIGAYEYYPPDPPVLIISSPGTVYSGFVAEIDATSTYNPDNDPLSVEWIVPDSIPVSSHNNLKIQFLAPVVTTVTTLSFKLNVSDEDSIQSKVVTIKIVPYKPDLVASKITDIEASSFQTPYIPANTADGNIATYWSSNGDNQWLIFTLAEPFKISHIELALLAGQHYSSYFDILASKDKLTWDSVLTKAASCNFSGARQEFDISSWFASNEYSYVKYVGHGNSVNDLNRVSEIKIFGLPQSDSGTEKERILLFPNPATNLINISILDESIKPDKVRIIDSSGKVLLEKATSPENRSIQFPINIRSGVYLLELASGNAVQLTRRLIVKN